MFYRFKSKLATQDRLELFIVYELGVDKRCFNPAVDAPGFKKVGNRFSFSSRLVKEYRRARVDPELTGFSLVFSEGKEREKIPDILCIQNFLIVSEKFKRVMSQNDDIDHQYIEIFFHDYRFQRLKREQSYFWFIPHRILTVEADGDVLESPQFVQIQHEEDFIHRALSNVKVREKIESFPLWSHFRLPGLDGILSGATTVVYFNQTMMNALREVNAGGFDEFSQRFGVGEESVVAL